MAETIITVSAFLKVLNEKERKMTYTGHAIQRARARKLISDSETTMPWFESALKKERPEVVAEQTSENLSERKFKLYYRSPEEGI